MGNSENVIPTRRLVLAATFWFASGAAWSAVGVVLLPDQVSRVVDEAHKGRALGAMLSAGAFLALFVAPWIGAWSDRVDSRWGRRAPFVLAGSIATAVSLALLALLPRGRRAMDYAWLLAGYLLFHATYNVAAAPIAAWIPDDVPEPQRGRASGWVALFRMFGTLSGGALGLAFSTLHRGGTYAVLCVICLAVVAPTLYGIASRGPKASRETPRQQHDDAPLAATDSPLRLRRRARGEALWRIPAFRAVFVARFAAMMGFFAVQSYLLYFLRDVVHWFGFASARLATTAEQASGLFMIVLVVGATIASPIAGQWFDGPRRSLAIHGSLALQIVAAILCAVMPSFAAVLVAALLFGAGFGAFQTATLALASSALPQQRTHARDLGIWNASLVLAQLVGAPTAGLVLDAVRTAEPAAPARGYSALFAAASLCFGIASFVLRDARSDRGH